jgi:hypothetical protein
MTPHDRFSFQIPSRLWLVLGFTLAALALPAASHAAILPVGGQINPTTVPPLADEGIPGGTVLANLVSPFAGIGFSGTLTSRVLQNDPSNPFPNGLTFTYQVSNAAASVHVLHRLTSSNYTGFSTDVSFGPAPGVPPSQADRTTADVVGFNFVEAPGGLGLIPPGSQSRLLVVQTSATQHVNSFVSLINGGVSTVPSFSPIPEPGTWILATIGLLGIAALLRRAHA